MCAVLKLLHNELSYSVHVVKKSTKYIFAAKQLELGMCYVFVIHLTSMVIPACSTLIYIFMRDIHFFLSLFHSNSTQTHTNTPTHTHTHKLMIQSNNPIRSRDLVFFLLKWKILFGTHISTSIFTYGFVVVVVAIIWTWTALKRTDWKIEIFQCSNFISELNNTQWSPMKRHTVKYWKKKKTATEKSKVSRETNVW